MRVVSDSTMFHHAALVSTNDYIVCIYMCVCDDIYIYTYTHICISPGNEATSQPEEISWSLLGGRSSGSPRAMIMDDPCGWSTLESTWASNWFGKAVERDCVSDKMKNQGDSVLPFALVRWCFGLEVANSQEHKPVNPRNYFASWLSSPVPCMPLAVRQSPVKPLATLAWQWTVPHFDGFPLCTFGFRIAIFDYRISPIWGLYSVLIGFVSFVSLKS